MEIALLLATNMITKPLRRVREAHDRGVWISFCLFGVLTASCSTLEGIRSGSKNHVAVRSESVFGEYTPEVGQSEYPSYFYYFDIETESNILKVSYWNKNLGLSGQESIEISFWPTTIGGPQSDRNRILIGGVAESGEAVLVEYKFDFLNGSEVKFSSLPYGDVSSISTISDFELFEENEQEVVYVLDGNLGEFGRLKKGEEYISLTDPGMNKRLWNYTHLTRGSFRPPSRTFWLSKGEESSSYYIETQSGALVLKVSDISLEAELLSATEMEPLSGSGFYY